MFKKVKTRELLNKLLTLSVYNPEDGLYHSKSGTEYVESIKSFLSGKNANDNPFLIEDILRQPTLNEFTFDGINDFEFICQLKASPMLINKDTGKKQNEKIKIVENSFASEEAKNVYEQALGVVYIITCPIDGKEHIIKIGNSRNTFKDRLGSYNCGVITNVRTASTTNIKLLQSFVATRKVFNVYIYDCSDVTTFKWHGVESVPFASPKGLAYEDILIKKFIEQFGIKPLANVQASATVVD